MNEETGFIIFAIILSLVCIIAPKMLWFLRYGLHVKDAEPTDFSIISTRIFGVVILVLIIISLLFDLG